MRHGEAMLLSVCDMYLVLVQGYQSLTETFIVMVMLFTGIVLAAVFLTDDITSKIDNRRYFRVEFDGWNVP